MEWWGVGKWTLCQLAGWSIIGVESVRVKHNQKLSFSVIITFSFSGNGHYVFGLISMVEVAMIIFSNLMSAGQWDVCVVVD